MYRLQFVHANSELISNIQYGNFREHSANLEATYSTFPRFCRHCVVELVRIVALLIIQDD